MQTEQDLPAPERAVLSLFRRPDVRVLNGALRSDRLNATHFVPPTRRTDESDRQADGSGDRRQPGNRRGDFA
ncbi:hypothetical protein GCM10017744_005870 [Streptomyces antimycoticus]|uniref:Uncharacterized protein n=1 Tax=Streptomyces antimycoticus TaxID=68175 RepID=A0A4D4KHU5_9ACTN|nr:hypothetical protein SANT12839_093970 [Streptomyces antimycoticus]